MVMKWLWKIGREIMHSGLPRLIKTLIEELKGKRHGWHGPEHDIKCTISAILYLHYSKTRRNRTYQEHATIMGLVNEGCDYVLNKERA